MTRQGKTSHTKKTISYVIYDIQMSHVIYHVCIYTYIICCRMFQTKISYKQFFITPRPKSVFWLMYFFEYYLLISTFVVHYIVNLIDTNLCCPFLQKQLIAASILTIALWFWADFQPQFSRRGRFHDPPAADAADDIPWIRPGRGWATADPIRYSHPKIFQTGKPWWM